MNAKFLIPIIAGTFFTLSAQAHDCSGGADGGMDATGNQCSDTAAVATNVSSGRSTSPSARSTKVETSKTLSGNKSAVKRSVVSRQARARSQSRPS